MKKRYVLKNKMKFFTFLIIMFSIAFITLYSTTVYGSKTAAYDKVVVQKGDTLWDIARDYSRNNDIREYIYKIKQLNKLASAQIYEGDELVVPLE